MNTEECCNGNCNQGRDCPKRNKELTDEEIINIWNEELTVLVTNEKFIKFARAILRKANEK
jgi:hypothetical protein